MLELHDTQPEYLVTPAEYHRLLGYPRDYQPGERALELMTWAREWFARHGRPWVYLRRVELAMTADGLSLDRAAFHSQRLRTHMERHGVVGAVLLAVSAGEACETHARQLWTEGKPDDYFFLESYGSAVVEDLVARASGQICALAGPEGLQAVPHYSPGYAGWDVAEQNPLYALITGDGQRALPGPLNVLASGMLRPKKSLLGVFGLAAASTRMLVATPCENCSFTPCSYRRAPYRHAADGPATPVNPPVPLTRDGRYQTSIRALRKWSAERVQLVNHPDGTTQATFRFDGTTCSNQGRPLAFDYQVTLSNRESGYRILKMACVPSPGDDGYQSTCAFLSDPNGFLPAITADQPLLGCPLDEVLAWSRVSSPSGCHCSAESRLHKWGLALEALHFTLSNQPVFEAVS